MALRSSITTGNTASIDFSDTDDWGSGFIGAVAITNTSGSSLDGWTLSFDLADTITNIWNAVIVSHVGTHYVIANAPWNATVGKDGAVSFGFQADGGTPVLPTSYTLNGVSIGSSSSPPPLPPPPAPSISIADASVTEAGGGPHDEAFVVTLSAASSTTVQVQYSTADGTAHAGSDYTTTSGTLTFAPGVTTETISVPTFAGVVGDENFTVQLAQPVGATLARAQATGTIINPAPVADVAPWVAAAVYTAGMTASEDGIVYRANWWTQGNDPMDNNGGLGTGEPWTNIGTVAPVTSVPTVPTGLTATTRTSTSVFLNWQAASVPGGGAVTGYGVFENGKQIATVSSTSDIVSGLTPSTTYSFAVDALDSVGASATSGSLTVTTSAPSSENANAGTYAPYIDMGLSQDANLLAIAQASGITTFTLAFIQSSGPGTIGWGGVGTIANDTLSDGSTILSRIQQLQAAGGNVIISFGGEAGTDPAVVATSAAQLQAEYQSVVDRYHVTSLDFDIEGAVEANQTSLHMRDQAILGLKAANPGLTISFTLPVLPTGLDYNGLNVVQTAKNDGLTPDVINIMAMDYGASVDNGGQMGADAISAVQATEQQLQFIGMNSKVGVTPLIGVNDIASEVFTLQDAQSLVNFASTDSDIARIAMWSVARDNGSMPNATYASDNASGIAQSQYQFSSIFEQFAAGTHS